MLSLCIPKEFEMEKQLKIKLQIINGAIMGFLKRYGIILTICCLLIFLIFGVFCWGNKENHAIEIPLSIILKISIVFLIVVVILGILNYLFKQIHYENRLAIRVRITNLFHQCALWGVPLIGLIGYILVYSGWLDEPTAKIIEKISDVLVIGGVVGFLTNTFQVFGIFKSELEKIIYSYAYVSNRKDVSKIWRDVSSVMFQRKFHSISEDLFSIIQDQYICKDEYSYYDSYRIITDVSWADDNHKFIIVKDHIRFDLVTEKKGSVELSFAAWFSGIAGLEEGKVYYHKFKCTVDGVEVKENPTNERNETANTYKITNVINIDNSSGKERYEISIERERKYLYMEDFDISFRARYIVKDMVISLSLPDDIKARFICRGTPKDFKIVKNEANQQEIIYRGLILQRQGYIFALHKVS